MLFQQFTKEKRLLQNVSENTVRWYAHALKWLPNEQPTNDELKLMVLSMRERGLKPTGCNAALRAINSYLTWLGTGQKVRLLRESREIMPTFTPDQIKLLVTSDYDPVLKSLIMLMLDTGCRISEALALRAEDVCTQAVVLHGKGAKDRVVPYSPCLKFDLPFPWNRHMALRRVKRLCRALGFEPPKRTLHSMRHTAFDNLIWPRLDTYNWPHLINKDGVRFDKVLPVSARMGCRGRNGV